MSETTGAFLKRYADRMCTWLREEGCEEVPTISTAIEATALAQQLRDRFLCAIDLRSFDLLETGNLEEELRHIVAFVRPRPETHDKFWRYLELFSNTVGTDE